MARTLTVIYYNPLAVSAFLSKRERRKRSNGGQPGDASQRIGLPIPMVPTEKRGEFTYGPFDPTDGVDPGYKLLLRVIAVLSDGGRDVVDLPGRKHPLRQYPLRGQKVTVKAATKPRSPGTRRR